MNRLRIAQVIRAWSAVGAVSATAAAVALQHNYMSAQAVLFFFTYMFATQWRERIIDGL
ncbi:hypothetical protein [Arthrobacter caoxuetaonis]|uniref:Uncharacterized protein n=1 Tax=Arthrobacter caoxuetaonis TaxID=2886935 RepID=A0A9X1MIF4_9MICC|nr:hypothetical protein [Arthrobacter caoxuetaonis]MCC3299790.1 hypothetical protein [Arthrobacter caoxuetaonis]USQ59310.1 hypothetical protein NF551_17140 [Arthrobacter caoxuetaonis]